MTNIYSRGLKPLDQYVLNWRVGDEPTKRNINNLESTKVARRRAREAKGESVRMVAAYQMEINLAKKIERMAHIYLRQTTCFLRGEWYRISSEACLAAVEKIIAENTRSPIDGLKIKW